MGVDADNLTDSERPHRDVSKKVVNETIHIEVDQATRTTRNNTHNNPHLVTHLELEQAKATPTSR